MDTNIFENTRVRAVWDAEAEKWWFSAVDFCMLLTDSDYNKARCSWKSLKYWLRKEKNQLVKQFDQLKLKSRDGKRRYADVLDIEQVLYLIQIVQSNAAKPYKLWLAKAAATNSAADGLAELGKRNNEGTREEIIGDDGRAVLRKTVMRREL